MKLLIKNMVCPRCIIVVRQILSEIGVESNEILLGEVELREEPTTEKLKILSEKLIDVGFELIKESNQAMVEHIKGLIIKKVQSGNIESHFCLSNYLKTNTLKDYSTLTKVFSAYENCTIEKFFILQRLEKSKEMLLYGDTAIKSIARNLGYSSPQYFATQFRKAYKYSPKSFKALGASARRSIDDVYI